MYRDLAITIALERELENKDGTSVDADTKEYLWPMWTGPDPPLDASILNCAPALANAGIKTRLA